MKKHRQNFCSYRLYIVERCNFNLKELIGSQPLILTSRGGERTMRKCREKSQKRDDLKKSFLQKRGERRKQNPIRFLPVQIVETFILRRAILVKSGK